MPLPESFESGFGDGAALAGIVAHYHPHLLARGAIIPGATAANMAAFLAAVRSVREVPVFVVASAPASNTPALVAQVHYLASRLLAVDVETRAALVIQRSWRLCVGLLRFRRRTNAALIIQAAFLDRLARREERRQRAVVRGRALAVRAAAATRIQAVWRMARARRHFKRCHFAALRIQSAWLEFLLARAEREEEDKVSAEAALARRQQEAEAEEARQRRAEARAAAKAQAEAQATAQAAARARLVKSASVAAPPKPTVERQASRATAPVKRPAAVESWPPRHLVDEVSERRRRRAEAERQRAAERAAAAAATEYDARRTVALRERFEAAHRAKSEASLRVQADKSEHVAQSTARSAAERKARMAAARARREGAAASHRAAAVAEMRRREARSAAQIEVSRAARAAAARTEAARVEAAAAAAQVRVAAESAARAVRLQRQHSAKTAPVAVAKPRHVLRKRRSAPVAQVAPEAKKPRVQAKTGSTLARKPRSPRQAAAATIQRAIRSWLAWRDSMNRLGAAIYLQSIFRGTLVRRSMSQAVAEQADRCAAANARAAAPREPSVVEMDAAIATLATSAQPANIQSAMDAVTRSVTLSDACLMRCCEPDALDAVLRVARACATTSQAPLLERCAAHLAELAEFADTENWGKELFSNGQIDAIFRLAEPHTGRKGLVKLTLQALDVAGESKNPRYLNLAASLSQ